MTPELLAEKERLRLVELFSHDILDTEEEKPFNDLTELASLICNCPMAGISFIDERRQWFKARKNIDLTQSPRNASFCTHTVLLDDFMQVRNASEDSRFEFNPVIVNSEVVLFYAGVPVHSASGQCLGTVFVMDTEPGKNLTQSQAESLKLISKQITHLLELKLRKKMILRQARTLVEVEKDIARLAKTEQESERKFIAHQLHENFAQTLAAIKLLIEFAEKSRESGGPFIQKSKDNLVQMINDLRNLSNSMVSPMISHEWKPNAEVESDEAHTVITYGCEDGTAGYNTN